MIKKENLDKTNAWPIVEAKKMLRERKSFIEKKGKINEWKKSKNKRSSIFYISRSSDCRGIQNMLFTGDSFL